MTKDEALNRGMELLRANISAQQWFKLEPEITALREALAEQPAQQEPADIFVEVALSNRWPCAKKGAGV